MGRQKKHSLTCDKCHGKCCRYVAMEIDTPASKRDYDHIRWYLLHKNVYVFVDHDNDWYVEFKTDCGELAEDNACSVYDQRPHICRKHGVDDGVCEFYAESEPYQHRFSTAAQFEAYLECRGIKWRWKKRA